jgi:steroid delta-isomerase-like uncharacterized protein
MFRYRDLVNRALAHFSDPATRDSYFDLYSPNVVLRGYDGVEPGLESAKGFYQNAIWAAFPDAAVEIEDYLESGDKCVARFVMTGTHRGPFNGVPATGKPIRMPGITIMRFEGSQCVERWSVADFAKVLAQIAI